jgi:transcriptional regulator with GAF, ATPase, and Fis domain
VVHPLPRRGEVSIGRSANCDVCVDQLSVSRLHAVLRLSPLAITDKNSSNGTRVAGRSVPPGEWVELGVGDLIEIGSVSLLVRPAVQAARPHRVWPHGYFEGRVEEECARSARAGRPFGLLRIDLDQPPAREVIDAVFAAALRSPDVLAVYADDAYEVLLLDVEPEQAAAASARLEQRLIAAGARVRLGLACFPRDAASPEELIAEACARVRGERQTAHPLGGKRLSPPMQALDALIQQVAPSLLSVLILGETGVGKEVCAERIHTLSPRKERTFLRLNCAALSESLLESELFGHEKGAFTGAHQAKPGLLESADGGTVFLDEVGDLPPSIQVKLLRVLDEKKTLRVGGLSPRSIDVRFVAATNRDLEADIGAGRFRQDLYYRLAGVTLFIPPLRERASEIAGLAEEFAARMTRQLGRARPPALTPAATQALERYHWPGNIRELRNVVERAVLLCGEGPLDERHLPVEKLQAALIERPQPATPERQPAEEFAASPHTVRIPKLTDEVRALEKQRILDALAECGGNQTKAAELLGVARGTLVKRLEEYGVARPRKPR